MRSRGWYIRYSNRLHDFSITIPRCYKDVSVNCSFPRTTRLYNSLPAEYFPLSYDLNDFKSRVNRHLLLAGYFYNVFLIDSHLYLLLFFATPTLAWSESQLKKQQKIKKLLNYCISWHCLPIQKTLFQFMNFEKGRRSNTV